MNTNYCGILRGNQTSSEMQPLFHSPNMDVSAADHVKIKTIWYFISEVPMYSTWLELLQCPHILLNLHFTPRDLLPAIAKSRQPRLFTLYAVYSGCVPTALYTEVAAVLCDHCITLTSFLVDFPNSVAIVQCTDKSMC